MDTFKKRLPLRQDLFSVFAIGSYPLHVWAIVGILLEMPSLLLRWGVGLVAILGIMYWFMHSGRLIFLDKLVERLLVLSSIYLFADVVSIIIVIVRNIV